MIDVLVVGSGGAGMSAAVAAREAGASTLIVTKSALGASNTSRAQGGIQAAVAEGDSTASHFDDTYAAGHRHADPDLVRTLVDGGPQAIDWLATLGVGFTREEGRYRVIRCGGASRERLLQAGERTGAEMVQALRRAVRASGAEVWESSALSALAVVGSRWRATVQRAGGATLVDCSAVVLAAGGGLAGEAVRFGSRSAPSGSGSIMRACVPAPTPPVPCGGGPRPDRQGPRWSPGSTAHR